MKNKDKEVVRLSNVGVKLDGVPILEDINLSVKEGDFLGVIGPNGGGKTTLLKAVLGLIPLDKGRVEVFGEKPEYVREFIGYVPQNHFFDRYFPISVWDVVLTGRISRLRPGRYFSRIDWERTHRALEAVGMLEFKDRSIGALSEGQRQRVFIARALTNDPRLFLLDEPTASVDPCIQAGLYETLTRLNEKMAIILVSHDIGVISRFVKQIACLNRRLFYHDAKEITLKDLEAVYKCPVDIIAHGVPHRVLKKH